MKRLEILGIYVMSTFAMFLSGLAEEARDLDDYFINYLNIVPDGDNLAIYKFGLTAGAILGPSLLIPLYNRMKFSTLFLIPTLTIFTASVFMLALDNFAIMAILQSIISLCGVFLFSLSMVYMVRVIRSNDKQVAGLNYRALVVPLIGFTLGQLTYGLLRIVVGYFSEMQHSQGILFIDSIFTDSCKITYVATVITSIIVLIALFKYRTIIDITYEPRELGGLFGTLDYQKVFLATLIISAFFGLSGTFTVDTGFVISNFSDIPWTTDNDIRLEIELTIVSLIALLLMTTVFRRLSFRKVMLFAGAFLSLVLILESILLYVNAFPKDTETTISYVFVFLYTFAVDIALWAGPMIFMLRLLPNEYLAIGIGVTQSILHFCTEILRLNELSFLSSSLFISAGVTICLTLLSLKLFPRAISLKVGGNAEIDRKVLGVDMQNSETLN